jgi:hypothetical protein
MRPRRPAVILAALIALALALGLAACGGSDDAERVAAPTTTPKPAGTGELERKPAEPQTTQPVKRVIAIVQRRTLLRRSPNGRRLGTIALKTRFGSRQQLAVVARRGSWLGVLHPTRAAAGPAGSRAMPSARRRTPGRWPSTAPRRSSGSAVRAASYGASRSPSGAPGRPPRSGATRHRPHQARGRSVYGCCILALSARQKNLPPGWAGGDRIALHGSPTDSVGGAVSAGCVRMKRKALRWLLRRVPDGTRVDIVA